jgi:beta-glucosidase
MPTAFKSTIVVLSALMIAPFCCRSGVVDGATYPFQDPGISVDARVADLVSRLTQVEKISQMGSEAPAIPRLGIDRYTYQNEACHGIVNGVFTVFPQAIALSSTWDLDLEYAIATAISDEARASNNSNHWVKGFDFWAPTINMCRDPRWGRNEESYGEDPFLVKKFAVQFVKGMQGNDPKYLKTIATVKHFACNNIEYNRASISSNVDETSLREYYLPAFQAAVTEGKVYSVMGAYNSLNSVPCCANKKLLTDILRNEWGFKGYVVSDCGAIDFMVSAHHYVSTYPQAVVAGCKAGCDLNCGSTYQQYMPIAMQSGLCAFREADIDTALKRIFKARMLLGEFDPPSMVSYKTIPASVICCPAHKALALKAGLESIVLLKNDGILPLDTGAVKTIAVIGPNANLCRFGGYSGIPDSSISILRGMVNRFGNSQGRKIYYSHGCDVNGARDQVEFDEAINFALNSDVVIMVMGTDQDYVGENKDLGSLNLPGAQEDLIKEVYSANPRMIVVLVNGNPLAINWEQNNVSGIVDVWFDGQLQGKALAEVLFGDYNPGGKLTATWVRSADDLPDIQDYTISNNRTYRYFQGSPLYPFGYGLSYTTFEFDNLTINPGSISSGDSISIQVDVKNTGNREGDEVVQLYIHNPSVRKKTAIKQLMGFQRISVQPGNTRTVTITIPYNELSTWDIPTQKFVVEPGTYGIMVGNSSADIKLTGQLIVSNNLPNPALPKIADFSLIKRKGCQDYRIVFNSRDFNTIEVLRPDGKVVTTIKNNGNAECNWRPVATGMYLIKVTQGNTTRMVRVFAVK